MLTFMLREKEYIKWTLVIRFFWFLKLVNCLRSVNIFSRHKINTEPTKSGWLQLKCGENSPELLQMFYLSSFIWSNYTFADWLEFEFYATLRQSVINRPLSVITYHWSPCEVWKCQFDSISPSQYRNFWDSALQCTLHTFACTIQEYSSINHYHQP